jgi:signal transduction histidine kinase
MATIEEPWAALRDEIVERYEKKLRSGPMVATAIPKHDLLDSLPAFLDALFEAVRAAEGEVPGETDTLRAIAREHGLQRLQLGFDVEAIVREYGMLRASLVEALHARGEPLSSASWTIVSEALSAGVEAAVHAYVKRRDEELRARTAEHFAFLAHEIRNPLSTATLALQLLRKTAPAGSERTLDGLGRALERLGDVVDQAIVETKVRAEGGVRREPVALRVLLAELEDELGPAAEQKRITRSVDVPDDLTVEADLRLLRSVLGNFTRNAIKFTHEGGHVVLRARQTTAGSAMVEVEDECGGLPAGAVDKLFDPFVQLGKDRSGFGLGLSIARQAAQALGGQVHVRDVAGQGCVFALELPSANRTR